MFAMLDLEQKIQLKDKTRLDASKCFTSRAVLDFNSLTITPELSEDPIDCLSVNPSDRFLDWAYSNKSIDVDGTNDDLIFNEGGADISVNITAGTYTIATYATEIAAQMTSGGSQTYTASSSLADQTITISADSSFKFKASSVATQSFFEFDVFNTSHTSDIVEYGNKIITVIISNGTETDTKYFYTKAYSELGDRLFSSDGDLMSHEPDIMKWVQDGRSSFKNAHRRSQSIIMAWIDEKGYQNSDGDKFTKNDIIDIEEVHQWSIYLTMRLIFQGMSNAIDDVFDRKSVMYSLNEEAAKQRVILRLDTDGDGVADLGEGIDPYSGSLFRR